MFGKEKSETEQRTTKIALKIAFENSFDTDLS